MCTHVHKIIESVFPITSITLSHLPFAPPVSTLSLACQSHSGTALHRVLGSLPALIYLISQLPPLLILHRSTR